MAATAPVAPTIVQMTAEGGVVPPAQLPNPNDVGLNMRLEAFVLEKESEDKPTNTSLAFDPKVTEFYQFCDHVYASSLSKYHLTYDKIYRFMFYLSFREKKKCGRKGDPQKFDVEGYKEVMKNFKDGSSVVNPPCPKNPISKSTFDQYKAVIKLIHRHEVAARTTSVPWEHLWQMGLDTLHKHVKGRQAAVKKANYAEKHNGEFAPYVIAERMDDIEDLFFRDSALGLSRRQICCRLRHRYVFLHLTAGILRSESLYRAEVSDFLGICPPKRPTDCHQPYIMINQLSFGKTNHGRVLYGRATRHKDVRLCPIGGLGLYYFYRFETTGEFRDLTVEDWLDNSKWFDIKLLVDVNGSDNTKAIQNDSFSDHMKSVLDRLSLPNNKILHLGRNVGAKTLDLHEVSEEDIRRMGNWNPSIFDKSYSSKIPMAAIRKLAGFVEDHKFYFVPRTAVEPPAELLHSTPIGKWCYNALEAVLEKDVDGKHITAVMVLRFMCELNKIVIQDVAAMSVLYSTERGNHPMFLDMECFKSEEFDTFKSKMKEELSNAVSPLDADLEKVLPGIHQWHGATHQTLQQVKTNVQDLTGAVQKTIDWFHEEGEARSLASDKRLATVFMDIAKQLLAAGGGDGGVDKGDLGGQPETFEVDNMLTGETCLDTVVMDTETENLVDIPAPVLNVGEPSDYKFRYRHNTLQSLWEEWNGKGEFSDSFGGIEGRNKAFGKKWRSSFTGSMKQHYSRLSRIVQAVLAFAESSGVSCPEDAVARLEDVFTKCNRSLPGMVKACQAMGLLRKKASRGKTQKQ